jgi:hypothetical protein
MPHRCVIHDRLAFLALQDIRERFFDKFGLMGKTALDATTFRLEFAPVLEKVLVRARVYLWSHVYCDACLACALPPSASVPPPLSRSSSHPRSRRLSVPR